MSSILGRDTQAVKQFDAFAADEATIRAVIASGEFADWTAECRLDCAASEYREAEELERVGNGGWIMATTEGR